MTERERLSLWEPSEREMAEARAGMFRHSPGDCNVCDELRIRVAGLETTPASDGFDAVNEFVKFGQELGELLRQKNAAYGDSFARTGDIFRALFPNGVRPDQYDDMLLMVRITDKFFRIANRKEGQGDAGGENPFFDISGYGALGVVKERRGK